MTERKVGKQSADTAAQTRQKIIQAARQIFVAQGFEEASLRDIAAQAGITHGLIRHYFGSKDEIWRAAVDEAVAKYTTTITLYARLATSEKSQAVGIAKTIIRRFLRLSAQYPDIIRLMLHDGIMGGERLNYAYHQFAAIGDMMKPLLDEVQQLGYLRQFDNQTFFLMLLTGGAAPFALSALSNLLLNAELSSESQVEQHIERFIVTLFGPADNK